MDETKILSETEGSQTLALSSSGSSDETQSVSETGGSQKLAEGSSGSPNGDPSRIGRYRIIHRLGQGGFGRVYLSHDDDLDRPVAIKVPNAERIASPEDVEAFLIEARILAKLDHPHIVPVFDVGRTEDGRCFVVSKLVEGSDLAVRMRQARPSFRDSAELVATVADALHYAHTRGLVHRDVKPANILIDASGKPCVADFGLALKDEDFGKSGEIAGTPAYMSPEQARGEGHRVDGRSDIFSLGVVLYELLTGKRPFRGDSLLEVMEQVTTTEPRPPRQIDDTIPRELERISLKALAKRAAERYTTADDMAEDLRHFLDHAAGPAVSPNPSLPGLLSPGTAQELTLQPTTPSSWEPEQRSIKIIPKGLRSFDEHDAEFFLELLPGARDRDGLPESIRFWKTRTESTDPGKTFRVGLIYGPSGCGKSSLVKAGLLPRLAKHVMPVYIEATPEETAGRLLKGLRKVCHELPPEADLVDSLAAIRTGRAILSGQKVLLVLDQFEQWLHAKRGEENTELVAALRQCDGVHAQAVVMVRDDFWMAATSFFDDVETVLILRQNAVAVDLFDPRHARKVLRALGTAYGNLPERTDDISRDQHAFLDQAITDLAQDGKIVSVRLALFAEMVKAKSWTPTTLREIGGTEGVGVTFLEETFGSAQANPRHRLHQKAARAVLKALLPESGTDIKGQMRSRQELLVASGYANRPRDFSEVIHVLDRELRLITPTNPESSDDDHSLTKPSERYYQLTHDYLVHSLRDWLTRKQRETRRGRAELRLAERSSLWNAKPENRHVPSVWEWANIWLLTKKSSWTQPERRMMWRAGQVHGLRALGLAAVVSLLIAAGLNVRRRVVDNNQATAAAGLVQQLLKVDTAGAPDVVRAMRGYRRWTEPELKRVVAAAAADSRSKLHASLALVEGDPSQAEYLFGQLQVAAPSALPALRKALEPHKSQLTPKLWSILDAAQPGDPRLLPCAGALALYDRDGARWDDVGGKVAEGLVTVNSLVLGPWLEALRPARQKLIAPLAAIFQDQARSDATAHSLATDILVDYASDDPDRLAGLLIVSDAKAFTQLFTVAERQAARTVPVLQAELAKLATFTWNDPALDPSWTKPDPALVARIEMAHGVLAERFAFCQTMPLDGFVTTAQALRKSGYRPVRFRPYADGQAARVAAVWTRDGRNWRISSGLPAEAVRQQDERNTKENFLPVDVAGYIATEKDSKPADRFAALWVEKSGDDDARMYVGTTTDEQEDVQDKFKEAKLIPRTQNAMIGPDGRVRYCGVWRRPPGADITGQTYRDQFEGNFEQNQANLSDRLLLDVAVSRASKPQSTRERAQADLQSAEKKLKTKPDDVGARLARAVAYFRLGENRKALDDLQVVTGKNPEAVSEGYRVIILARLGKKQDAQSELEKFQKADAPKRSKLYVAAVVAAELGEGADKACEALEAAIAKQPRDAGLRYDAARALSLASKAISCFDTAKARRLADRCFELLREAVKTDDADFANMDEDAGFDPIREDPAFAEIMKAGHPDRRYAAAWSSDASFEASPIYGLGPAAALRKCRELIAQGYRPVSWSASQSATEGQPVTASVWHRPVITEETRNRLAERQARAGVALVRMDKGEEVWPLLRHSADPRLRSFIVNWLNPLGADPRPIVAELNRIDPNNVGRGSPDPAEEPDRRSSAPGETVDFGRPSVPGRAATLRVPGDLATRGDSPATPGTRRVAPPATRTMDAVLFQPETSERRALILALGTYGTEGMSPGEREPLIGKLLDLYRNDPDAGIHGAAEWTLRQWKQQEKLKELDAELMKVKDWSDRRWYVNSQGQTFAVIEGPVEFRMGSPPTETERFEGETPKHMRIPRRFAIADKEVTVEQFQRFLKLAGITSERYQVPASFLNKFSPDPQGPWIQLDWYTAAHYCNWLSEQEGLPKEQWCYVRNEAGAYAEGMSIPADVLERTGYRLPTGAEWEYACRAGAFTSRCYGHSLRLLDAYARYQANSDVHAWTCGSLFSNDLGLFDMLGNVYEWCQDSSNAPQPGKKGTYDDIISISESISEKNPRLLRGGAFGYPPSIVRSAYRGRYAPSGRDTVDGFRPARTYH